MRLDGVPINKIREGSGLMAIDGFDLALLQHVELVRGPGSALHGNAAFHGVLSMETLDPESTGATGALELGSYDYSAASLSASLRENRHGFTLGAAYRSIGDVNQEYIYQHDTSGEMTLASRRNARENSNLLAKYAHRGDDLGVSATVYLQSFEAQELPGVGETALGNLQDKDITHYSYDMQLALLSATRRFAETNSLAAKAFYWQYQDAYNIDATLLAGVGREYISERQEAHTGLQLHHTFEFSQGAYFTYGYEYLSAKLTDFTRQEHYPDQPWEEPISQDGKGYHRQVHSVLLDGHHRLTEGGLDLSYGLRWDRYSDFNEQFNPRLGLSQWLGKGQTLHFTYGEGFRAPTLAEYLGEDLLAANKNLQPERLESAEIKYTLETRRTFHNLTLFYNHWHDAIVREVLDEPIGDYLAQNSNQGNAASRGVECEIMASGQRWQADFALSYVDDINESSGEDRKGFPEWIADLKLGYHLSQKWQSWFISRYMDVEPFHTDHGPAEPEDYLRVDLTLGWQGDSGLALNIVIRNIFDRNQALIYSQGWKEGVQDEGRNISTQLRYSF